MKFSLIISSLFISAITLISCSEEDVMPSCNDTVNQIKINEYKIIGSHNSYRQVTDPDLMQFMLSAGELLPDDFDPLSWDYDNAPILEQLNSFGIRSIELDVYRDPQGGLFYNRMGNGFVGRDIASGISELEEPGLKILHFPDFDYNSEFISFKDALNTLENWSDSNPEHLPVYVLVEAKEDNPDAMLPGFGLTASLDFSGNAVEEIENEIIEVFGPVSNSLLRPDDVILSNKTLKESVESNAWPSLEESRGKLILILMAEDHVIQSYTDGNSLEGRSMFVFTDAEKDEAAFLNITDPISNYNDIREYVDRGFIVRTQSDSDTYEARDGDYERMNSAFDSGAQIICTDYYRPDPRHNTSSDWTDYSVSFNAGQIAVSLNDIGNCSIEE